MWLRAQDIAAYQPEKRRRVECRTPCAASPRFSMNERGPCRHQRSRPMSVSTEENEQNSANSYAPQVIVLITATASGCFKIRSCRRITRTSVWSRVNVCRVLLFSSM